MDIIARIIAELPIEITYEGVSFNMSIFHNGGEMRLCYGINYVSQESPHKPLYDSDNIWNNPFIGSEGTYICDFLYLREGIYSLEDLDTAVTRCLKFIQDKGLQTSL